MSGHVEGSKAFARYREIDDEIKKDALKGIGQLQKLSLKLGSKKI